MSGPVERSREPAGGSTPDAETMRAVRTLATVEVICGVVLAGLFVYLFGLDNDLSDDERMSWAYVGVGAFFACSLGVVLGVFLPAAIRAKAAQDAQERRSGQ